MLEHLGIGLSMHVVGHTTRTASAFQINFALRLLNSINPPRLTHISLGLRISSTRFDKFLETMLSGDWSAIERTIDSLPTLTSVRILAAKSRRLFTLHDFGSPLKPAYQTFIKHRFQLLEARGILQFV